jgi:hypothetical protein
MDKYIIKNSILIALLVCIINTIFSQLYFILPNKYFNKLTNYLKYINDNIIYSNILLFSIVFISCIIYTEFLQ